MSQPHDPHAQSEHVDASDVLGSIPVGFPTHSHTHTSNPTRRAHGVWATAVAAGQEADSDRILSATISNFVEGKPRRVGRNTLSFGVAKNIYTLLFA